MMEDPTLKQQVRESQEYGRMSGERTLGEHIAEKSAEVSTWPAWAQPFERVEGEAREARRTGPWTIKRRSAGGFELDPHPFLGHNDRLVVVPVEREHEDTPNTAALHRACEVVHKALDGGWAEAEKPSPSDVQSLVESILAAARPVSGRDHQMSTEALRLYWCGDCEQWSSLACHDEQHHQRSFESVAYVPAGSAKASRIENCGCAERCGDDGDIDGPGTCKDLPAMPSEPLARAVLVDKRSGEVV